MLCSLGGRTCAALSCCSSSLFIRSLPPRRWARRTLVGGILRRPKLSSFSLEHTDCTPSATAAAAHAGLSRCREEGVVSIPNTTPATTPQAEQLERENATLTTLIKKKKYDHAVAAWGRLKKAELFDDRTYQLLFRLCQRLGSGEVADAVRKDMFVKLPSQKNQTVMMSLYFQALVDSSELDRAMEFVRETELKTSPSFMAGLANFLSSHGHHDSALQVCEISCLSESSADVNGLVMAAKIRALGMLNRLPSAQKLFDNSYTDLRTAPVSVQIALADVLSVCDKPHEAFRILEYVNTLASTTVHVPIWSLALLMKSLRHANEYVLAAQVYHHLWDRRTLQASAHPDLCDPNSTNNRADLANVLNCALYLQALAKRAHGQRSENIEELMKEFLEYPVLEDISSFYTANKDTYKVALLHGTVYPESVNFARTWFNSLYNTGRRPSPDSLTSWASQCGPVLPSVAIEVLSAVRLHCHVADVSLQLEHFKQLLSLQYLISGDCTNYTHEQKLSVKCIKLIQKMMERSGVLTDVTAYNSVLEGYSRTGDLGAVFMFYHDMSEAEVPADLHTYHIMIDTVLTDASHRSSKAVIYKTWRLFLKEVPQIQPDISLLNKLIRCCRLCSQFDRAFYILTTLESFTVSPDISTFQELMETCVVTEDREKLATVAIMAHKCLPHQEAAVSSLVSVMERRIEEFSAKRGRTEQQTNKRSEVGYLKSFLAYPDTSTSHDLGST